MTKKNLAIICLSQTDGGMELAAIKIAKLLAEDVNIHFITKKDSYIEQNLDQFISNDLIHLYSIDFRYSLSLNLILKVRNILITNQIKNILFLGASEIKSLYFATYKLNINFIIRQGSTKKTSKKDFLHKLFYSRVNYFIGNSEYMKNNILNILPIPKNAEVKTIYASASLPSKLPNRHPQSQKINLIHVGRVCEGKGQLDTIKACATLLKENIDFSLKFVGSIQDIYYFNQIQTYLKTSNFSKQVTFIGHTTNVKKFLQKADIFIFPSLGEGMSNAVIEALSYGLITIVYKNTSFPEFSKLGFHIHLVKNKDLKDLSNQLLKTSKNIIVEKEQSLKNFSLSKTVFSINKEKESYFNLLK